MPKKKELDQSVGVISNSSNIFYLFYDSIGQAFRFKIKCDVNVIALFVVVVLFSISIRNIWVGN